MPAFVGAAAMQLLFGRSGIGQPAAAATGSASRIPLMEGLNGVIFVESAALLPVHPAEPVGRRWRNIDTAMEESAQNLGARGFRLFRRIVFPLAMPGYVAGASLVFIKVFDDLGTPLVLNVTNMLAPQAYLRVTSIGIEDPIGYVICVILVVFSIAAMWRLDAGSCAGATTRRCSAAAPGSRGAGSRPGRRPSPTAGSSLVLLLVLSPHIGILLLSLSKVWSFSLLPELFTLAHYATVFADSTRMIGNTLLYCGLAALLDVVIGTAIAYLVLRTQLPGPAAARPPGHGGAGHARRRARHRLPARLPRRRVALHRTRRSPRAG